MQAINKNADTNMDNKYLGRLCKRGHEWEETGKSLRLKSNSACVICEKIRQQSGGYKATQIKYRRTPEVRERDRIRSRSDRINLTGRYVRNNLISFGFPKECITDVVIESKRLQLQIFRFLRDSEKMKKPLKGEKITLAGVNGNGHSTSLTS